MSNIVLKAFSEAKLMRLLESAEKYNIKVTFCGNAKKDALPPGVDYLGLIGLEGSEEDFVKMGRYAIELDNLTEMWEKSYGKAN